MRPVDCPVIVIGAPRSGTSLVQKILREHEGFRSVAKESGFIWEPWTHPSNNQWHYEGWKSGILTEEEVKKIRRQFNRYAFSSRMWKKTRKLNALSYRRIPWLAPLLRYGYDALTKLRQVKMSASDNAGHVSCERLVDKSTNCALYLPLVEQVFPGAIYIHVVREGNATVRAMVESWLNPSRFFTFDVPATLSIPDYPYRRWNFALPAGWQEMRDQVIADVAAFQWVALQEEILTFFESRKNQRVLRVNLESLARDPEAILREIAGFVGLPWSNYFESLAKDLPRVNARPRSYGSGKFESCIWERMDQMSGFWVHRIEELNVRLGYSEAP